MVKAYRVARTENANGAEALQRCIEGYQNPVPQDVLDQPDAARRARSDGSFVRAGVAAASRGRDRQRGTARTRRLQRGEHDSPLRIPSRADAETSRAACGAARRRRPCGTARRCARAAVVHPPARSACACSDRLRRARRAGLRLSNTMRPRCQAMRASSFVGLEPGSRSGSAGRRRRGLETA